MSTAAVSDRGQGVIPAEIRRLLGIAPGTRLDFTIEGHSLRVEVARRAAPTRLEDGWPADHARTRHSAGSRRPCMQATITTTSG